MTLDLVRPSRRRDELQAHYTKEPAVLEYMATRLDPHPGDVIWEPCAGSGELIDAVLTREPGVDVIAHEVDANAAAYLSEKYRTSRSVSIESADVIQMFADPLFRSIRRFNKVLANPPYGAWQEPKRRALLSRAFPSLYVRDTYAVFLFGCLEWLDDGGRLVFIVPETYLSLHRHEFLRRHLLKSASIEEIVVFPSRIFARSSFGYADMSIITLQKTPPRAETELRFVSGLTAARHLQQLATGDTTHLSVHRSRQFDILGDVAAVIGSRPRTHVGSEERCVQSLGEIADVVTGFYSGHDRRWLRRSSEAPKRTRHFTLVDTGKVANGPADLGGINGERCFLPLMRGGAGMFFKPTVFFVDWSHDAVAEYRRKGPNPARFQNSKYYFKDGIGVPMVASSKLTAALLENRLFDQGIVGVFPKNPQLLQYMLGYLNTTIATRNLRAINPTANNSANYLKRLPLPMPTAAELENITRLVDVLIQQARSGQTDPEALQALETFFAAACGQGSDVGAAGRV